MMMDAGSEQTDRDARLDAILHAYLQQQEAGCPQDYARWLTQYPEFASELAAFFADEQRCAALLRPLQHMAAAYAELPLGERVGNYELLKVIGRGGMGIVYLARQSAPRRHVAVKMLLAGRFASDEDVARFRREAEATTGQRASGMLEPETLPANAFSIGGPCAKWPFILQETASQPARRTG